MRLIGRTFYLQNVFGGRCVDHVALAPDVLDPSLELLALAGVPGDEEPVEVPRVRGPRGR